jgi:predicted MFS family arabinose efflux permease
MDRNLRDYLVISGNYGVFTVTDGAIRMLVVLHFYQLGYSPFEIALLFLFYEFFGIVTNLVGGWLGARLGLNLTMQVGTALQVGALLLLTVPAAWLSVPYVMTAQALSGIAKDLNKMSAKAGVKLVSGDSDHQLFNWVAWITGSKNALKGVGFFVGAALLAAVGFREALFILAGGLAISLLFTLGLPRGMGAVKEKAPFAAMFARDPAINGLSAARFFLFGARDVWFVVALPVFLVSIGWDFEAVGAYLALWVIGYGVVQAAAPKLLRARERNPGAATVAAWTIGLAAVPLLIWAGLQSALPVDAVVVAGLAVFGIVFALNSALHSYLILKYSDFDKAAMNVGFYYAANAGGRLLGTVLSGLAYQSIGLAGCLLISAGFVALAALLTTSLRQRVASA